MLEGLISLIQFVLNLDEHLIYFVDSYGFLVYVTLFLIIFLETGVVILPFLPGDSLIFVAGTISALNYLNIWALFLLITLAAILGDSLNYAIGSFFGKKIVKSNSLLFNKKYYYRTLDFYRRHGGKTIILARFIPIIRTFAPFVAGLVSMSYRHFLIYNVLGGIIWVGLFSIGGFLFGNLPIVQENFSLVIFLIIAFSIIPIITEIIREKKRLKSAHKG